MFPAPLVFIPLLFLAGHAQSDDLMKNHHVPQQCMTFEARFAPENKELCDNTADTVESHVQLYDPEQQQQ